MQTERFDLFGPCRAPQVTCRTEGVRVSACRRVKKGVKWLNTMQQRGGDRISRAAIFWRRPHMYATGLQSFRANGARAAALEVATAIG